MGSAKSLQATAVTCSRQKGQQIAVEHDRLSGAEDWRDDDCEWIHAGECAQPGLYQVARAGTKRVIGEYLEEVDRRLGARRPAVRRAPELAAAADRRLTPRVN